MSTPPARRRSALGFERLETREVPSFSPFQNPGGLSIAVGDVFPEVAIGAVENEIVVGSGKGEQPYVRVYTPAGVLEAEFLAYEASFTGGVNVALADVVIGDQFQEIITGPGFGGGPVVKVFNPNNRILLRSYVAFEPSFRGGVNVAGGQLNLATATEEIVAAAGFGGGPVVRVFNENGSAFSSFFAYESSFRNGVNVAVGDILSTAGGANSGEEIATGPGESGAPLLKVFGGTGDLRRSYFAFDQADRNGLVVAVGNTENALSNEIFAAAQFTPLTVAPRIRSFNGNSSGQIESDFSPYPAGFTRYINFAAGEVNPFFTIGTPFVNNNAGDLSVVSGEGPTSQQPRVFFGLTGSAAGNNGP
ncbi:MAG TPA: hypothetical protein VD866_03770 [Urbifossiella sp.]|nr:hypothetical protein [Urbifossiella sp.]